MATGTGMVSPISKDGKPTYMLSNVHEWEGLDHQLTSLLTLLALAKNTSTIAVMPPLAGGGGAGHGNQSLIGDLFDADEMRKSQKLLTFREFMRSPAYAALAAATPGTVPFPKNSQEEYEAQLHLLGTLDESYVSFRMPHEDIENTNQFCDGFPGTVFDAGAFRFVFLDRVHFFHFCTENFMPYWYNVRVHLAPRKPYFDAVKRFKKLLKRPLTVVHIRDLMDPAPHPEEDEVERYARQIADALRKHNALRGTLYLAYPQGGVSVKRVANLLRGELDNVRTCEHLYACGTAVPDTIFKPRLDPVDHQRMFRSHYGKDLVEWALSMNADYFIGNIHSPYSRNVALYRKLKGKSYSIVKGFGEMRKIWKWHL